MKKGLLTVINYVSDRKGTAVQNRWWANFFDKYLDQLPIDVEFLVNANAPDNLYTQAAGKHCCRFLLNNPCGPDVGKWLAQDSFFKARDSGYKYWLMFHGDCFPPFQSLKTICDCFENNDVDWMTFVSHYILFVSPPFKEKLQNNWKLKPWGMVPGTGFMGGNVSFLNSICNIIGKDPFVQKKLSYNAACSLLGCPLDSIDHTLQFDNHINTDFMTYLYASGARLGLVVNDDGRSFTRRSGANVIHTLPLAIRGGVPYHLLKDRDDLNPSIPYFPIIAPFFHFGSSRGYDIMAYSGLKEWAGLTDPQQALRWLYYAISLLLFAHATGMFVDNMVRIINEMCDRVVVGGIIDKNNIKPLLQQMICDVIDCVRGHFIDYFNHCNMDDIVNYWA